MRGWNFETPLSLRLQIRRQRRPTDFPSRGIPSRQQGTATFFFSRSAAGLESSRLHILPLRLLVRAVGAGSCVHVWESRDKV